MTTTEMPEPGEESGAEPTDEQLRSEEAMRYRLRAKDAEDQLAAANTRAEEAERLAVDANVRGFADREDFWSRTELAQLRGEDGNIDLGAVQSHADELLQAHPHWRVDTRPGAAAAESVNAGGLIGYGPRSVLDTENTAPAPAARSFAEFLNDAVQGK